MILLKYFVKSMLYMETTLTASVAKGTKWQGLWSNFLPFFNTWKEIFLNGIIQEKWPRRQNFVPFKHANMIPGTHTLVDATGPSHSEGFPQNWWTLLKRCCSQSPFESPDASLHEKVVANYNHLHTQIQCQGIKKNYHVDLCHWTRRMKQHDLGLRLSHFTQNSDLITRSCFFTKEDSSSSCFKTSIWTEVTLLYLFVNCSSCSSMTDAVLK